MLYEAAKDRICKQLDELSDDDLLGIYREAMYWDGSFDFVDTFDIYELGEISDKEHLIDAIVYGNVTNTSDPVRYNGYGNLESVSEYDLVDEARDKYNLAELADWLIDHHNHADLNCHDGEDIQHTIDLYERHEEPEEDVADAIVRMYE